MKTNWIKYLVTSIVMLLLIVLVWGLAYQFELRLDSISNSIFIISVSVLAIALIIHTGATRATLGLSYTARAMFSPTKIKEKYHNFQEYYDEKAPGHVKRLDYIIIVSIIFVIIAFVLSMIYISSVPNV